MSLSTRKRSRRPIKQRSSSTHWPALILLLVVALGFGITRLTASPDDVPTQATDPVPTETVDAEIPAPSSLEGKVETFVRLYVSPSTRKSRKRLLQLCLDRSAFERLGIDTDDSPKDGKKQPKLATIDRTKPNKVNIDELASGFVEATSTTFVLYDSPEDQPIAIEISYTTRWYERSDDEWKFVELISAD